IFNDAVAQRGFRLASSVTRRFDTPRFIAQRLGRLEEKPAAATNFQQLATPAKAAQSVCIRASQIRDLVRVRHRALAIEVAEGGRRNKRIRAQQSAPRAANDSKMQAIRLASCRKYSRTQGGRLEPLRIYLHVFDTGPAKRTRSIVKIRNGHPRRRTASS